MMIECSTSAGGAFVINRQMLSGIMATRTFSRTDISYAIYEPEAGLLMARAIASPTAHPALRSTSIRAPSLSPPQW